MERSEQALQSYAYAPGLLFTSEKAGTQVIKDNVVDETLRYLQEDLSNAHRDRVAKQST